MFSPLSIAGCFAWYDFSVAANLTISANYVTSVIDSSGNGLTLTNASWPSPYRGALGGQNGITFDNTPPILQTATFTQSLPVTVFFVGQLSAIVGSDQVSFGFDTSVGGSPAFYQDNSSGNKWSLGGSPGVNYGPSDLNPHVFSCLFYAGGGNLDSLYVDGVSNGAPGNATGGVGWAGARIVVACTVQSTVATYPWNGQIGELIFYNTILSTANRVNVEQYLLAKWLHNGSLGIHSSQGMSVSSPLGRN